MSEPSNKKKGGERLAGGGAVPKPKRKKKPDTRARGEIIRHRAFIAVTVISAVIVAVFIGVNLFLQEPEVPQEPEAPKATDMVDLTPGPHEASGRKKQYFTFLVIGRDTGGGGNTDTIMLAAYDVPNQKLSVMSIPRDTMVNVGWDIKRVNSVYNFYGAGEKGIDALYREISQLVGFRPDFRVIVEWEGFGRLVDAIGGVYFDVPRNMNYDDPTQDLHIHINKGPQTLDGKQAMQVIRYRHDNRRADGTMPGYANGDIGRIETQQAFMKEVIAQCLKADNMIANFMDYAKIFLECVETDLTLGNLGWLAQQAIGGLDMENINFVTMPGNYNATAWSYEYENYQSYVTPSGEELVTLVNEHFNPYLVDVTITELDIMSVNKDGSLSSSSGTVEDKRAAKPPVKSTPKPTEPPLPEESAELSPGVDESLPPEVIPSGAPGTSVPPEGAATPGVIGTPTLPPVTEPTPAPPATPTVPATPAPTAAPTVEPTVPTLPPMPTPEPNHGEAPPEGIPIL